jgi:hypothetical protein
VLAAGAASCRAPDTRIAQQRADPPPAEALAATRSHVADHGADILEEFVALLSLPNVASDAPGIAANAAWIIEALMHELDLGRSEGRGESLADLWYGIDLLGGVLSLP